MKNSTLRVMALFSLIATLGPFAAMAEGPYPFTVPFDFNVGTMSFIAGKYTVQETGSQVFVLRSADYSKTMVFIGRRVEPAKGADNLGVLTFNRYGTSYFLSRFSHGGNGSAIPMSRREKELLAKRASHKPLEIIASKE